LLGLVGHADGDLSARGFGRKEGATKQRLQQLEARATELERRADKVVNERAEQIGRKLSAHRQELEDFATRGTEREQRRQAVMRKIGAGVDPALDRAREVAINRATARLLGYIDQEALTAVLAPDLQTRAMVQQGTKAGTVGGEVLRSLMLFKSFSFAIVDKHLRRIQNIPTAQGKVAYSVAMMTSLTLFGAISLQLKDVASGKDPRDMTSPKFWMAAFSQGGGLGVFGDVLYTGMGGNTRGGQANWTSLAGPVFGNVFDGLNVIRRGAGWAIADEGDAHTARRQFGADALRFAKSNAPFVNLWYARAAVDHMVMHNMQESLSPGYLRRMQRRAQKEYGQRYWWEPGDKLPDRAPNLEAAVGEH